MAKRPPLSVVEKIQHKQAAAAAAVRINPGDIANLIYAAKLGLQHLGDDDCINVANSLKNLAAVVKAAVNAPAAPPAAPAQAAAAAAAAT